MPRIKDRMFFQKSFAKWSPGVYYKTNFIQELEQDKSEL